MDWYLDGNDPRGAALLRHEVMAYLRRHASPSSSTDEAELVVAEMLGNAVQHAGGPVWVSLVWRESSPLITVRDLGPGFDDAFLSDSPDSPDLVPITPTGDAVLVDVDQPPDPFAEGGRGLFLISHLAPTLEAGTAVSGGGSRVSAVLPVSRETTSSHDPGPRETPSLPSLDEAQPEGAFGRETFLRALVVQMAQTLEFQQGQDAADAAVAQVGTDIGGQMEEEFRRARGLVDQMTPAQLGECYVRLKHAIDGDFYVIESDDDRIVLGNRRCPFGEAVIQAPSLCRMTSSVFGGIAARNNDGPVHVALEERIAAGDPGCRVVIHLKEPPEEQRPFVHRYDPRPDAGTR